MSDNLEIPAKFYTHSGGEDYPISLDAFLNHGGLITIKLNEESWIELSPLSAKALMAKLNVGMKDSVAALLSTEE
jgi:hypothetical protein